MNDNAFIGRQPILDLNRRVVGHELLYRHDGAADSARITNEFAACVDIVNNTLSNMGTEWLLGNSSAFINITQDLLDAEPLDLLPPSRVVLEFGVEPGKHAELPSQLRQARDQGFRIALEDVLPGRHTHPLLDSADYIKLDVQRFDIRTLTRAVEHFRHYPLKLVAKKIETMQEYLACVELGFDYFQGYFLAHPETLSVKVINPATTLVVELLDKVNAKADPAELEECFKRDVALSFKLLRYINSAGFGLNTPVRSIQHALTLLGYRPLLRWLAVMLITSAPAPAAPALLQMAMARGRFAELLGQRFLEGGDRDNLFIVGVFSMLDVILEVSLEKLLENLNLPDDMIAALLHRQGIYAIYLNMVEASENLDWEKIEYFSQSLQLSAESVNQAHFEALVWAERVLAQ